MVRTYGLTHINLVVRDVERSLRFYRQVFGVEEYGRTEGLVHTRTPGCQDVITFDEQASGAGESRGIAHFGFRLVSPGDIDAAVDEMALPRQDAVMAHLKATLPFIVVLAAGLALIYYPEGARWAEFVRALRDALMVAGIIGIIIETWAAAVLIDHVATRISETSSGL